MGLLMFYGTECTHCHEMIPLIEKLEKEEKIKVKQIETWHNAVNKKKLQEADKGGKCGGVPFFLNEETGKTICGSVPYDKLKKWAGK
jgi:thiol-disulfide isomerase/thioredoxin